MGSEVWLSFNFIGPYSQCKLQVNSTAKSIYILLQLKQMRSGAKLVVGPLNELYEQTTFNRQDFKPVFCASLQTNQSILKFLFFTNVHYEKLTSYLFLALFFSCCSRPLVILRRFIVRWVSGEKSTFSMLALLCHAILKVITDLGMSILYTWSKYPLLWLYIFLRKQSGSHFTI